MENRHGLVFESLKSLFLGRWMPLNFNDVAIFGREDDTEFVQIWGPVAPSLRQKVMVVAPKVGKPFLVRFGEGCQRFSRENVTDLCEKTRFLRKKCRHFLGRRDTEICVKFEV